MIKILVGGRHNEPKLMEGSSNTTREKFHRNNGTCVSKGEFKFRILTALVEYLQDGLKAKGNPWVVRLINIVGKSESFKKLSRKLGIT